MKIVTQQFLDKLKRIGAPVESVVRAGPLPDVAVIIRGAYIHRQAFLAKFADGQVATYRVDPDGLTLLSGPAFDWKAAATG